MAAALGAKPLDAEESENFSLGAVARSGRFSATIDAYLIKIADRIVLSENLGAGSSATDAAIRAIVQAANPNVDAARFFINGVDTESFGVDLVVSYRLPTDNAGNWEFTLGANVNQTDITGLPAQPAGVLPIGSVSLTEAVLDELSSPPQAAASRARTATAVTRNLRLITL
ncbi:MAG: TonB-dependent receptor [Ilumatobacteraceae bacterium]